MFIATSFCWLVECRFSLTRIYVVKAGNVTSRALHHFENADLATAEPNHRSIFSPSAKTRFRVMPNQSVTFTGCFPLKTGDTESLKDLVGIHNQARRFKEHPNEVV
jgi:hypothetical protein